MSRENIEKRLDVKPAKGRSIPVICLQTNMIFKSFEHAAREYNLKTPQKIKACCEGIQNIYGKLQDGTKLQWMYYKDYLKLQNNGYIAVRIA
jgi:hypothetical protein